jgi:hypothetical protein
MAARVRPDALSAGERSRNPFFAISMPTMLSGSRVPSGRRSVNSPPEIWTGILRTPALAALEGEHGGRRTGPVVGAFRYEDFDRVAPAKLEFLQGEGAFAVGLDGLRLDCLPRGVPHPEGEGPRVGRGTDQPRGLHDAAPDEGSVGAGLGHPAETGGDLEGLDGHLYLLVQFDEGVGFQVDSLAGLEYEAVARELGVFAVDGGRDEFQAAAEEDLDAIAFVVEARAHAFVYGEDHCVGIGRSRALRGCGGVRARGLHGAGGGYPSGFHGHSLGQPEEVGRVYGHFLVGNVEILQDFGELGPEGGKFSECLPVQPECDSLFGRNENASGILSESRRIDDASAHGRGEPLQSGVADDPDSGLEFRDSALELAGNDAGAPRREGSLGKGRMSAAERGIRLEEGRMLAGARRRGERGCKVPG